MYVAGTAALNWGRGASASGLSWKILKILFFPVAHSGWIQELFLWLVFDDLRELTIVIFVPVKEEI